MAIFPEPGGILFWGSDGGGADYFWDTSADDPNEWTVVITGRPVGPCPQRHPHSLTAYLARLAAGSIKAAALGEWPGPTPEIRRLEEPF